MPNPCPPGHRVELRLALSMNGGVSLAVWIGGAVSEIDCLRRGEGFWGDLLEGVRVPARGARRRDDRCLGGRVERGADGAVHPVGDTICRVPCRCGKTMPTSTPC